LTTSTAISISFDLKATLVYPNPRVKQDTLAVMRGPIVFVAEDVDNSEVEEAYPHFDHIGLSESASFSATRATVVGVDIIVLHTDDAYVRDITSAKRSDGRTPLYSVVQPGVHVRSWAKASQPLTFIPWFARGNRGGKGHLRVPFMRVGVEEIQ
jgi:DUF1680 family protein